MYGDGAVGGVIFMYFFFYNLIWFSFFSQCFLGVGFGTVDRIGRVMGGISNFFLFYFVTHFLQFKFCKIYWNFLFL